MDNKFQPSFIPKKPIVIGQGSSSQVPTVYIGNIFSTIATTVFVLTIGVYGGLFLYQNILSNEIAKADKAVVEASGTFEPDTIKELINASARIKYAKILLQNHIATSQFFDSLQKLTEQKIRFSNLSYTNSNNLINVKMDVEALSYNALSQQSIAFMQSDSVQGPNFSDFELDANGNIKAKFSATINPALVSYKNAIESGTQAPTQTQ